VIGIHRARRWASDHRGVPGVVAGAAVVGFEAFVAFKERR